jgi:predicted nuclease of restriction endonuclease-like (RecB) superfamily
MISEVKIHGFANWVSELKTRIHTARRKAAFSLNSQLIELYWDIGKTIAEKQMNAEWGSNLIEKVAGELKNEFPEMKGFSRRNLYAMSQWYKFYSKAYQFVPHHVAQIPWSHNRLIISKVKNIDEAEFYCSSLIQNGWDRDTLELQIKKGLYEKAGKAINNFANTLPSSQSKLAAEALKDPYNFDFLSLHDDALEKAIEEELTKQITKFLLELGKGFAFLGRQYKIEISETDYFIDMLFYHTTLHCYVVIELKSGKFKPDFAGKLNFYLSAVDSLIKKPEDNQSIGILLCKSKDRIEVEYALRDINKPMGVSEYLLTDIIPEELKAKLPSIEELENELEKNLITDSNIQD